MNTSTYNRLSSTVYTTRKSQAMIACAWVARNSRQDGRRKPGPVDMVPPQAAAELTAQHPVLVAQHRQVDESQ